MINYVKKYSIIISSLLLLVLLVLSWRFPAFGSAPGIVFLGLSFVIASLAIIQKHRQEYKQGGISRLALIRRVLLEISGILFAMILAGLLARYISEIVTRHIGNDLTRFLGGLVIGLMVGVGVGILVRRAWGRLQNSA